MSDDAIFVMNECVGFVFRHKRLFNYLVSPLHLENNMVKCHVGVNSYREIPIDYFKRDWRKDDSIPYNELLTKMSEFADQTPFTAVYDLEYEEDDGRPHSYIHFKDDLEEKMTRFPMWHLTTCTKAERIDTINPYTMIMPIKDGMESEVQAELDIINEIRSENEFIQVDDFKGFEFGLIKILEKKYLRLI